MPTSNSWEVAVKLVAVLVSVVALAALVVPGASSGQSSALPALDITVGGGSIAVNGTVQSGATTLNITNSAAKKQAGVVIVRLQPGVTVDELLAAAAGASDDPNVIAPYGTIDFDLTVDPGVTAVDTVLRAGSYVALDPSAGNPSKWPHTEFTVAQASTEAALPSAAKSISSLDFGFKAPKSIKRGSVVRFQQTGNVMHMIAAIKVQNAFVAKQLVKLLEAGKDKKANKLAQGFAGFVDPASGGTVQQEKVTAAPGQYVLACFLPTQDGRPHTRIGMAKPLKITK
jgi:hypothetical protein